MHRTLILTLSSNSYFNPFISLYPSTQEVAYLLFCFARLPFQIVLYVLQGIMYRRIVLPIPTASVPPVRHAERENTSAPPALPTWMPPVAVSC
jgi:hypothetical protein